ncbi:Ig-like domain-containing protein [Deinococcus koreensis]|uniref:BIG2 domain-containing protein n=1 Tax=Deinococcus koreensis TaxID=2054903 RepID=A0A2K3UWX1_9DEIO|nr:Ig-like domain-containing protein [Deinococcus koreensis]PNY81030.1 hypothetical protein CVO96_06240 [Deinococcus koreensis]
MLQTSAVRRTTTAALALTVSFSLMACNNNTAPVPSNITSVTVSADKTSLAIGETAQAVANVVVTNNAAKTVTWSTTNANVATVNASTGEIKAVAVGNADIVATSTVDTGKKGKVTITVTAAPALTTAKISFRPASAPTVSGYTVNTGAAFDGTSGWVQEGTKTPLDMTANTRYRDAAADTTNIVQGLEPRQYGQLQMQCGTPTTGNPCSAGTLTSGAFEYKVVNGKYNVTVSVGDSDKRNTNSLYAINVEGASAIAAFAPTAGQFKTGSALVTVSDGFLSIDAVGGKNTKLNYVDITPAP